MQMRNLVLSAFPRKMRLPDPFTQDLRVESLPEVAQHPRISPAVSKLLPEDLSKEIDPFLDGRDPAITGAGKMLMQKFVPTGSNPTSTYNTSLINAVVFYIGLKGIEHEMKVSGRSAPVANFESPSIQLLLALMKDSDPGMVSLQLYAFFPYLNLLYLIYLRYFIAHVSQSMLQNAATSS